jgi:hypothetical protein
MGRNRASLLLRQGTWGAEASLRVAARRRGKYRPPRENHRPDPKGGFCSSQEGLDDYAHPTQETIGEDPPPRRFSEFNNDTLAVMASQGVHGAFKERLLREIMSVDGSTYSEAYRVLGVMNLENEQFMALFKLPYKAPPTASTTTYALTHSRVPARGHGGRPGRATQVGIATTVGFGLGAIPAVFHRDFAIWFCSRVRPANPSPWYVLGARAIYSSGLQPDD